jgi:8-amino-7-oxononanoate synthase
MLTAGGKPLHCRTTPWNRDVGVIMTSLTDKLQQLREQNLFRRRSVLESPQGVELGIAGETLLSFCSNDYLGLASDPRLIQALQHGAERYGVGSGASHLVTGHSMPHHALEEELAEFVGAERALLFSTGYMANLGVVSTLMTRGQRIVEDRLNHASLIDAARLSGAKVKRFRHGDPGHARDQLDGESGMIVSDAVFSMDGDRAPLGPLYELAKDTGSWLLLDDAHGLGIQGEHGRGSLNHHGLAATDPVVYMGTLGKALGTFGAFVAGSADLVEYLAQRARTYIYTTALPPAVAEATRESLRIVASEDWRRARLREHIRRFRDGAAQLGLELLPSDTAIQPLMLGETERALRVAEQLRSRGILVPAIRPPTVAAGTARLRITFSAAHEAEHVDRLLDVLASVGTAP